MDLPYNYVIAAIIILTVGFVFTKTSLFSNTQVMQLALFIQQNFQTILLHARNLATKENLNNFIQGGALAGTTTYLLDGEFQKALLAFLIFGAFIVLLHNYRDKPTP